MRFNRCRTELQARSLVFIALVLLSSPSRSLAAPHFDSAFWKHWSDGKAEINSYLLTQPRYGETREGLAVSIFVTEPFAEGPRVKADPGKHPESGVVNVMKLNLVEDFPTGVYDYNVMTSTFVALEGINGFTPGEPLKVSFSSQEWCGHVYSQLLPEHYSAKHSSHSYFDGEADLEEEISLPDSWVSEDSILHWARGFAEPFVTQGESVQRAMLISLKESRLAHTALKILSAQFEVGSTPVEVRVPAGTFTAIEKTVLREDGLKYRIWVEQAAPHRILRLERNDGYQAELLASERLAYWALNSSKGAAYLEQLRLRARNRTSP